MSKEDIARAISEARKKAKLTQKQLAEKLNKSQQIIGHWETGYSQPDIYTMFEICNICGVSLNDVYYSITKKEFKNNGIISVSDLSIVNLYKQLNEEGQQKLISYANDLISTGNYTKSDKAIG